MADRAAWGEGACLLIFTKPARAGRVKTRLIGALTAEQAARLHGAFLDDLLTRLKLGPFDLGIAWALEEGEAPPPSSVAGERQVGGDLGERLFHALSGAAARYPRVAAVGSDHPELPLERVVEAFGHLDSGVDVVLGPATDGGYYLIGLLREAVHPELFRGIPWSGPEVLEATLERCRGLGLEARLLPPAADVDTPADLRRLAKALTTDREACPRTRQILCELGWIPGG